MIYTSYQIADMIGVNVSTIKRWTDSGKLTCYQTVGGHRKFHLNDISTFLKNSKKHNNNINVSYLVGKSKKINEAISSIDTKALIDFSYKSLISGKSNKFISILNSLILKGQPKYFIFDEVIIPILIKIGAEWEKGKLSITEEHLASEIIRKYLSNLNFNHITKKLDYNAFCFTLINDKHDIPLHMGEAVMNENNKIRTYNLGSNLPVDDFINLSKKIKADIVFISIIYIEDKSLIKEQIKLLSNHFSDTNTPILIRGIGTNRIRLKHNNVITIDSFKAFDLYLSDNYK